jgi:hypothetical protein
MFKKQESQATTTHPRYLSYQPSRSNFNFYGKDKGMQTVQQSIETFLDVVSKCAERSQVIESIKQLRSTKGYKCPSVSVFALHLILDLYGEDSSQQANINRITTNLEAAAGDLVHLSRRLREMS